MFYMIPGANVVTNICNIRGNCIAGPKVRRFRLPRLHCCSIFDQNRKRHILTSEPRSEPSTMKIGLSVRAVSETKKMEKKF
jgi:hypothetical protein